MTDRNDHGDAIDPADSEAVFDEVVRLEELERLEEATELVERMLESPTPSEYARYNGKIWIASSGAPPEKALAYAQRLVDERPTDSVAWLALELAAERCGRTSDAAVAAARRAELDTSDKVPPSKE